MEDMSFKHVKKSQIDGGFRVSPVGDEMIKVIANSSKFEEIYELNLSNTNISD